MKQLLLRMPGSFDIYRPHRRGVAPLFAVSVTALCMAVCAFTAQASRQDDLSVAPGPLPTDSVAQMTDAQYEELFDSVPGYSENRPLIIKVTPVDYDREKPEQPVMHYYDKHGNELETPVRFLSELDTVQSVRPGPVYPAYNGTTIGLNVFDFIMMAVGQRRLSVDISAEVSLWNWISPVAELGLGYANAWPEDGRCRVRTNPTLYGKVGFNYNFLYKSNPDYSLFAGFRAGYSDFHFSVTDIQAGSVYYDAAGGKNLNAVHATCWYGQVLVGIRVKVYRCFSMGWTGRLGFRFRTRTSADGVEPWFIPGYGRGSMSATYSLMFSF